LTLSLLQHLVLQLFTYHWSWILLLKSIAKSWLWLWLHQKTMNPIFEVIKLSHCSLHHIVILILLMRLYVLNDRTCLLVIFTKTSSNCLVEACTYLILVLLDVSGSSLQLLRIPHWNLVRTSLVSVDYITVLWSKVTFLLNCEIIESFSL